MQEKVLVLFSGGLDSMLAACKMIEEGYKVMLVHYDNGASSGVERVEKNCTKINRTIRRESSGIFGYWNDSGFF